MTNELSSLLYQVIELKRAIPEAGITRGTRGTIVLIFEKPEPAFGVEFVDELGRTVAQLVRSRDAFDLVPY